MRRLRERLLGRALERLAPGQGLAQSLVETRHQHRATRGEVLVLGSFQGTLGVWRPYAIPFATLLHHLVLFGPTGAGKSTLGVNVAYQLAALPGRYGLIVIDLKDGALTNEIAAVLPSHRLPDCLYFDAADSAFPLALNPLADVAAEDRSLAAAELVTCFKRLFADGWGPRLEYVLLQVLLTLLEVPDATLLDIVRILTEEAYRSWALTHVTNFSVRAFWDAQFSGIVGRSGSTANVQSILNKLGIFAFPEVRNMLGQTSPGLAPRTWLDSGKIVLWNVPQGVVGEQAAFFLAALISAKVQLAAQSRARHALAARRPAVLFADEFQNFATNSFEKSITEGRSMGLGILAACQFPGQLSSALRQTIEKNCAFQLACQRRGSEHRVLITPLQEPEREQLTVDALALPPLPHRDRDQVDRIRRQSRALLARPRLLVESAIAARLAPQSAAERSATRKEGTHGYQYYIDEEA